MTLAILGLALALIIGYKPPWSSGLGLKGPLPNWPLVCGWRARRQSCDNRPVAFSMSIWPGIAIASATARRSSLPPNLAIELLTVSGEKRAADT